jgi:hypothetical protein
MRDGTTRLPNERWGSNSTGNACRSGAAGAATGAPWKRQALAQQKALEVMSYSRNLVTAPIGKAAYRGGAEAYRLSDEPRAVLGRRLPPPLSKFDAPDKFIECTQYDIGMENAAPNLRARMVAAKSPVSRRTAAEFAAYVADFVGSEIGARCQRYCDLRARQRLQPIRRLVGEFAETLEVLRNRTVNNGQAVYPFPRRLIHARRPVAETRA